MLFVGSIEGEQIINVTVEEGCKIIELLSSFKFTETGLHGKSDFEILGYTLGRKPNGDFLENTQMPHPI